MALTKTLAVRRRIEPTIALINIVFLMLVFFLVAGTLARPLDRALKLVSVSGLERRPPPDALVVYPDGRLAFRGQPATPADYLAIVASEDAATGRADEAGVDGPTARVVPDRELLAAGLLATIGQLRAAGAARVLVVTERGLE